MAMTVSYHHLVQKYRFCYIEVLLPEKSLDILIRFFIYRTNLKIFHPDFLCLACLTVTGFGYNNHGHGHEPGLKILEAVMLDGW